MAKDLTKDKHYQAMRLRDQANDARRDALKLTIDHAVETAEAELRSCLKYLDKMPEDQREGELFRVVRRATENGFNQALHCIQPTTFGCFEASSDRVTSHS